MFSLLCNYLYDFYYFFLICKTFKAFKITFWKYETKPINKKYIRFYLFLSQRDMNLSNKAKLWLQLSEIFTILGEQLTSTEILMALN